LQNQQIDLHNNLDFAKLSQLKYVNGELLRVSIQSTMVTADDNEKSNTESQNELQLTTVNNIRFELQYLLANGEYSASVEAVDDQMKFVVQPILQLKLIPMRFEEKMHIPDAFVCLKLRPLYDATDVTNLLASNDSDDQFFMKSRFAHKFRGLMFVLCTSSDGYLYQIEQPKTDCNFFLTHYDSMSSQIKDVAIANGVLHVATDLGLETYSLPKLTINNHHAAEHSSSNSNTCLFGLRPFPYLKKTLSQGESLVLLAHVISTPLPEVTDTVSTDSGAGETRNFFQKAISKSLSAYTATSNNLARKPQPSSVATANWTIYSLTNPPISQLYVDFMELANKNYEKSPLVYAHLLFCVHSILCDTKLFASLAKDDKKIGFDATYSELQQHWSPELEELYKQSCSSLADFFIITDNEYQYAFEFYMKAGIGLPNILTRCEKRSKEPHVGLIWTLRKFLMELITTNTDTVIETLNSPVEINDKTLRFGDAFLEFLAKWNPQMISDLYLSFEILRCVISEKTYEILLRGDSPRSNQDVVCICLHLMRKDELGTSLKLLESVTLNDLRHILTIYWQLLFEPALVTHQRRKLSKVSSFSFFTEVCFLQNPNPDFQKLLVEVLIEILFSYRVEFEDVLKTCFVDYMSGLAGSPKHSAACQSTMLIFLEKYFTRLHAINRNLTMKGLKPYSAAKSETTTTSSYLLGGAPNESVDAQDFPSLEETSSIAELELISREKEPQTSLVNNEGIKILIRIYLGQLRLYAMKRKTCVQSQVATKPEFTMKNVKVLESEINQFASVAKTANYAHMRQIILNGNDGDDTPILFLEERYDFLNLIPPFYRNIIGEGDGEEMSKLDQNAFLTTTIKIQSLLCNKKILSEETRREIVHFLQSNNDILGIDLIVALKVCILNKQHALELLLNYCPQGINGIINALALLTDVCFFFRDFVFCEKTFCPRFRMDLYYQIV
jgi:Hermansky-Pudlak syndrome 3, middle region